LMAQSTNVYSLNAVGYINVTVQPGFNIVSSPLISVDTAGNTNAISNILNNATGTYKKWQFWGFTGGVYSEAVGNATEWVQGTASSALTLAPGSAAWLYNPGANPSNITFVGTVPSGTLVNTLVSNSFNLVSSILPTSGDIVTNPLMAFTTGTKKDQMWEYVPGVAGAAGKYTEAIYTTKWTGGTDPTGDPVQPTIGSGFWYLNNQSTNNNWVENFSVGQ